MNLFTNNKQLLNKVFILSLLAFFIYIPFHPFFTAWVGSLTGIYAPIKIWKDLLIAGLTVPVITYSLIKPDLRSIVWRDPLNLLIFAYVLLHFVLFSVFAGSVEESAFAGLIFNLRFFALFMLIRVLLAAHIDSEGYLLKPMQKILIVGTVIVALIAVLQIMTPLKGAYEFFGYDGVNTISPVSYVDNDPNTPRAFSTLRGPNELGSYLILPITTVLGMILFGLRNRYTYILLALFATALLASYSRSALIGTVFAFTTLLAVHLGAKITNKQRILGALSVLFIGSIILWGSLSIPQLRMFIFHSSPGDPTLFEGSTQDHFVATAKGIDDVIENPFGRGPGEAGPASFYQTDSAARIPENYFVQVAQEVGVVGFGLFIFITFVVAKRLFAHKNEVYSLILLSSLAGLTAANLFLHSWADDPTAYVWWGFAAVVLGYNERNSWIKSKSSSHSKT